MRSHYDAIVVGARCAGSPTAMLLARKGYRVLVVDRSTFPSDTISSHLIHPPGVAALDRWGLLEKVIATGCPPIDTYSFDFGAVTIEGAPGTAEAPVAYCPRRTVLDKILVDAAAEAGAEIREGFVVDEIAMDEGRVVGIEGHSKGGAPVCEQADLVIGADGRYSVIAKAVLPEQYNEVPPLAIAYYSYWSNLPMNGRFETYLRDKRGFAAAPTNDGQTLIIASWPFEEFEVNKRDIEAAFLDTLDLVPDFAERIRSAKRESKFAGAPAPSFFRKPYGPGWALVGDAGYNKDPITAQGMTDAFLDAERCVAALDRSFSGAASFDEAMADYQRERDEQAVPMFEMTCEIATLEAPDPEKQQLFGAIQGNQKAMDRFVQMNAGTIPPDEFIAPADVAASRGIF